MDEMTHFRICAIEAELEYLRGKLLALTTPEDRREALLASMLYKAVSDSFVEGFVEGLGCASGTEKGLSIEV